MTCLAVILRRVRIIRESFQAGQRALISALAAGAAMELGRDPPPFAWVGGQIDLNPERGTQPLNRWETYEQKAALEWSL
jgi:hypothetical protein